MAGNQYSGRRKDPGSVRSQRAARKPAARDTFALLDDGPPSWLTAEAAAIWRRLVPELRRAEIVREVDAVSLAAFCQNAHRLAELERVIQKAPGQLDRRMMMTVKDVTLLLIRLANELGLTPTGRLRFTGQTKAPADPADNGLDALIAEAKAAVQPAKRG